MSRARVQVPAVRLPDFPGKIATSIKDHLYARVIRRRLHQVLAVMVVNNHRVNKLTLKVTPWAYLGQFTRRVEGKMKWAGISLGFGPQTRPLAKRELGFGPRNTPNRRDEILAWNGPLGVNFDRVRNNPETNSIGSSHREQWFWRRGPIGSPGFRTQLALSK